VIAAAGNEGSTTPIYPAAIAGVLGVGAVDQSNKLPLVELWSDR